MYKSLVGIAATMLLALVAVGCESMKGGSSSASDTPMADKAVVATAGNGGSVVFLPGHGGTVQVLSAGGTLGGCEVCKSDAAMYFMTGKLAEKCTVCGATRIAVTRGK